MTAALILAALALVLVGHGVGKLSRAPVVVDPLAASGFPEDYYTPFGVFDLVLAAGLFTGIVVEPVGFFSLFVLVFYCLLAFGFFVRAGHPQAVPMLVFAALAGYAVYALMTASGQPPRPDPADVEDLERFGFVAQSFFDQSR